MTIITAKWLYFKPYVGEGIRYRISRYQSVISRIEAGNQNFTIRTLAKIAATLHTALIIHLRHTH